MLDFACTYVIWKISASEICFKSSVRAKLKGMVFLTSSKCDCSEKFSVTWMWQLNLCIVNDKKSFPKNLIWS